MKTDYFFGLSQEGFHRVAYREWGQAAAGSVPVICVHGMTRNGRDFDTLANYLSSQGRHVFCPDVVGRGDSDWLKKSQNYTFEQYSADMNALIARTGATQVDWVGTSMGGLIGMLMASLPNSPIRRLIINDIGPQIPKKAIQRLARYTGKDPEFSSITAARAYYKVSYGAFGKLTEDQWDRITQSSIKEIAPGRFVSKVDPALRHVPAKGCFLWNLITQPRKTLGGILFDIDLWHLWRTISCPVHVIHGKQSDLLLPSIIAKMRATHSKMEVLEVATAGHAPVLEGTEELETISRWLS
jgi:pimeloyl-ACP methyl ester carboxylesterase